MAFVSPPAADPIQLFLAWYAEAVQAEQSFADGMALATSDSRGRPSVRVVLFRGMSEGGLRFFTNLESRKARELAENPRAALMFHWAVLGRQVRFEGSVERLPDEEADAYFRARPRGSQLAAWASPQSQPLADEHVLEQAALQQAQKFAGRDVPRPPFWGGFRVLPDVVEFWINREHRLHDRIAYTRQGDHWTQTRLGA
jgi:pyridoxamine 5'-phosphate oxidase